MPGRCTGLRLPLPGPVPAHLPHRLPGGHGGRLPLPLPTGAHCPSLTGVHTHAVQCPTCKKVHGVRTGTRPLTGQMSHRSHLFSKLTTASCQPPSCLSIRPLPLLSRWPLATLLSLQAETRLLAWSRGQWNHRDSLQLPARSKSLSQAAQPSCDAVQSSTKCSPCLPPYSQWCRCRAPSTPSPGPPTRPPTSPGWPTSRTTPRGRGSH